MNNKKVTPMELNDEALEGATGGGTVVTVVLPADGRRTCNKCGKTNFEVKVSLYGRNYYCDDCYKNLYNKTETN